MRRLVVVGTALVGLSLAACGATTPASPSAPSPARPAAPDASVIAPVGGILGSSSVWSLDVRTAPVAADSAAEVAGLVGHITDRYGGIAAFNAHQFSVSLTIAGPATPRVDVGFTDCQHKGTEPPGLADQLAGVPIPTTATPAPGSDHGLTVWQPSTDTVWELWRVTHSGPQWTACYGGRLDHASMSTGFFGGQFGESASDLVLAGGMVGIAQARAGRIDHALGLAIPDPAAGRFVYPAQNSDGTSSAADAIPEGTRLRLDPRIDVATLPGLTALGRVIARSAQTYGFIVTDGSGAVAVTGEDGAASMAVTGVDPWAALEDGLPDYEVLRGFPWQDLEVLSPGYGQPG